MLYSRKKKSKSKKIQTRRKSQPSNPPYYRPTSANAIPYEIPPEFHANPQNCNYLINFKRRSLDNGVADFEQLMAKHRVHLMVGQKLLKCMKSTWDLIFDNFRPAVHSSSAVYDFFRRENLPPGVRKSGSTVGAQKYKVSKIMVEIKCSDLIIGLNARRHFWKLSWEALTHAKSFVFVYRVHLQSTFNAIKK